jgi:hypothetical protein
MDGLTCLLGGPQDQVHARAGRDADYEIDPEQSLHGLLEPRACFRDAVFADIDENGRDTIFVLSGVLFFCSSLKCTHETTC